MQYRLHEPMVAVLHTTDRLKIITIPRNAVLVAAEDLSSRIGTELVHVVCSLYGDAVVTVVVSELLDRCGRRQELAASCCSD